MGLFFFDFASLASPNTENYPEEAYLEADRIKIIL